jgi:hypothetical protein
VYSWLRTREPDAVVGELPALKDLPMLPATYEYLSTAHWHPLVNGYSGLAPPHYPQIARELDAFPDPTSVEDLRGLGVRYLVAHLDELNAVERQRLADADLTTLRVSVAANFGSDVVYELAAPSNLDSLSEHVQIGMPQTVARGRPVYFTLSIVNDTTEALVAPSDIYGETQWDGFSASTFPRQDLPTFFEPATTAFLHFPVDVPAGLETADSATLHVRLTGALNTEVAQRVQFADMLTSTQRTGLAGTVERVLVPPSVHPDVRFPVQAIAQNSGRAVWLPELQTNPTADGRVGLSVRNWISPDGTETPPLNYSTAHLDWNVNPNQSAGFTIVTQAPHLPGHYQLVLDLLSENVTWFSDLDAGTKMIVPVDVVP